MCRMSRMKSCAQCAWLASAILVLASTACLSAQAPTAALPTTGTPQDRALLSPDNAATQSPPSSPPPRATPPPQPSASGQTSNVVARITAPIKRRQRHKAQARRCRRPSGWGRGYRRRQAAGQGRERARCPVTKTSLRGGLHLPLHEPQPSHRPLGTGSSSCPCGGSTRAISRWAAKSESGTSFITTRTSGSAPADRHGNNGYLLERYLLHGDLHLSPFFRFFGQFQSGLEDGRIGGPRPDIDRNAFDVHQAFFDFMLPFDDMKDSLTWRVGRQEMSYGTGRLIDTREGVNLARSFDEVRAAQGGPMAGGRMVGQARAQPSRRVR